MDRADGTAGHMYLLSFRIWQRGPKTGHPDQIDLHITSSIQMAHNAIIVTQYQRMVHHPLADYGGRGAFARRLGPNDDGAVLQKLPEDIYCGDRWLNK
ncbi:DUF892 family protein [uncultured Tateyamaria sp.]|uniref:DUF892 family protein n=1 Tax=uncultured Tateyamaria sp. TaxID=455651 RepID=UPI002627268A|nr:DUF892 family protein [uncultured Tateyamaria sp.]